MDGQGFDVVGVRRNGLVAGFVERDELFDGPCGAVMKEFREDFALPDAAPLLEVVKLACLAGRESSSPLSAGRRGL